MGLVHFGAPEREVEYLVNAMALSVFFEGGTYKGETALRASRSIDKVFTVERSEFMFATAQSAIGDVKNIVMLKGDSRDHLQAVLDANDNIIFWLDAHWSGGNTYGESDECPLLDELRIIFSNKKNYVILIDDARLFLAPPPKPHVLGQWPTIKAIVRILPEDWDVVVYEDVIYLLPGNVSLMFREFVQGDVTAKWREVSRRASLANRILRAPILIIRRLTARMRGIT